MELVEYLQHADSTTPQLRVCPLPVNIESLVQFVDLVQRHVDATIYIVESEHVHQTKCHS